MIKVNKPDCPKCGTRHFPPPINYCSKPGTGIKQTALKSEIPSPAEQDKRGDPRFIDPETGRYSDRLYQRELMRQRRAKQKDQT